MDVDFLVREYWVCTLGNGFPERRFTAQEMRRAVAELLAHIDTLESMRSRLCAALGLPVDSAPETVAEALNHTALVGRGELSILRDFAARRMGTRESDRLEMTQDGYAETLRALRANQGGA